jgi:putative hydrolase of the HAD superfamily
MNIKAIGFDYGGVVAGIPGPEFERQVTGLLGVDLETFKSAYFEFNHLMNNNVLSRDEFWKKVVEELGLSNKLNELIEFIDGLPQHVINMEIIGLSDRLRVNGYKTGLLSNNTMETAQKFRASDLISHFDAAVFSAEIGVSKPNPMAFKIFCERLGVALNEMAFIDDTEKSLAAATTIGFTPILFTGYETLVQTLRSKGINI